MKYLLIHSVVLVLAGATMVGLGAAMALSGCTTNRSTDDNVTVTLNADLYDTTPIDLNNLPSKEDTAGVLANLSPGQQTAFNKTAREIREWTQSPQQAWFAVSLTPFRALGEIRDRSRVNGLEPSLMPAIAAYWQRLINR